MKIILRAKENVYEQIVNEYKRYISMNIIRYDEKLPSCRQLASELGINPNTVVRAYNVLENEGYIKVIPKKGVYVCYKQNEFDTYIKKDIEEYLNSLKSQNISYEVISEIINKVYGRDK